MCKIHETSQPVSCECQLCLVYLIEFNIMLYYNKISSLFLIVIELYSLSVIGKSVTACFSCCVFDTGSIETSLYQFLVIQAV